MKGCYALVYRRRSEADEQVPEVPEHIEEIVALKAVVQVFSDMNTNGVVVLNSMRSHRNVYRVFFCKFLECNDDVSFVRACVCQSVFAPSAAFA